MKIMCTLSNGKEVERHKVCFNLRKDKNHEDVLHGVGAVYQKQSDGSLRRLDKPVKMKKADRKRMRKMRAQDNRTIQDNTFLDCPTQLT